MTRPDMALPTSQEDIARFFAGKPASFWHGKPVGSALQGADGEWTVSGRPAALAPMAEQRPAFFLIRSQRALFAAALAAGLAASLIGVPHWAGVLGFGAAAMTGIDQAQKFATYAVDRHDVQKMFGDDGTSGVSLTPSIGKVLREFFARPLTEQMRGVSRALIGATVQQPSQAQVGKLAGYAVAMGAFGPGAIAMAAAFEAVNWGVTGIGYALHADTVRDPAAAARAFNGRRQSLRRTAS